MHSSKPCVAAFGAAYASLREWCGFSFGQSSFEGDGPELGGAAPSLRDISPAVVLVRSVGAGSGLTSLLSAVHNMLSKDFTVCVMMKFYVQTCFHCASCEQGVTVIATTGAALSAPRDDSADPLKELSKSIAQFTSRGQSCVVIVDDADDIGLLGADSDAVHAFATLMRTMLSSPPPKRCRFIIGCHGSRLHRSLSPLVEHTIELGLPDDLARRSLIDHCAARSPLTSSERIVLDSLHLATRGFSISQIVRVFRVATLLADSGSETLPFADTLPSALQLVSDSMSSSWCSSGVSFRAVAAPVTGSTAAALGRPDLTKPVTWHRVGGYDDIKRRLVQLVAWPLFHPEKLEEFGVSTGLPWSDLG